jgi:hypothetical protein
VVNEHLRLGIMLAPDIVEAVYLDTLPGNVTLVSLLREGVATSWDEQRWVLISDGQPQAEYASLLRYTQATFWAVWPDPYLP